MNWRLKDRMFMGLIGAVFFVQILLITVASLFVDDFLIYRDVKEFELVIQAIRERGDILDYNELLEEIRQELGGVVLVVADTENIQPDNRSQYDESSNTHFKDQDMPFDRGLKEIDQAAMDEIILQLEVGSEDVFTMTTEEDVIVAGRIDDVHILVNDIRLDIVEDMTKMLNTYLGIATIIIFSLLLAAIYHYIGYFERKMTFEAQSEILLSLGQTADAHFAENGEHIDRVSGMMSRYSEVLGYSKRECEMIRIASTTHDIGKIAIPDEILKKPGKLSDAEFRIMQTHTSEGGRILGNSRLPIIRMASQIALYHHERVDGKGYPNRLKALEIPELAKMMAIVDVYDALTNVRVYKDAFSHKDAMKILKEGNGTQFDMGLLHLFVMNSDFIISGSRTENTYGKIIKRQNFLLS